MMSRHEPVKQVQLREAKAKLSELVADAERGNETVITRHGRAIARIVRERPSNEKERVDRPGSRYHGMTLGELLLNIPEPIEAERDRTPWRVPDL